jgi:8-amino-3,8-dideoxy-alpha-D-manno-octulosonate transaminase
VGATPVFADIDRTLNLDPEDFARKLTPATRAVIVVHFQGGVNNMDRVLEIAREHDVKVIEDCAQAWGGSYRGRKLGSLGEVGCFSFQQNKILTSGDGGLLATSDPVVFERAVRFHDLGFMRGGLAQQLEGEPQLEPAGALQFRMNEFTGAVALAQLRKLEGQVLRPLREHFHALRAELSATCPGVRFRESGDVAGDCGLALYLDLEEADRAEWFTQALQAEGIRAKPATACSNLLHTDLVQNRRQTHPLLPPFGPGAPGEPRTYTPADCPAADHLRKSMTSLILVPWMTEQERGEIVTAVRKAWSGRPWQRS